jgi:hypothetical protein
MNVKLNVPDRASFDLDLRGRIVVVKGFSGTGKTLFYKAMESALKVYDSGKLPETILVNRKNSEYKLPEIYKAHHKFIVIDNADRVFDLHPELVRYINQDFTNNYLIFARKAYDLGISPNYFAEFCDYDKLIKLKYSYSMEGWY